VFLNIDHGKVKSAEMSIQRPSFPLNVLNIFKYTMFTKMQLKYAQESFKG